MASPEPRRDRRTYTLKDDAPMYAAFGKYTFLTCEQAAQITGRRVDTLQKRYRNLFKGGIVNRVRLTDQYSLREPYVYFLDKEGARRACDLGELPEPRYIQSKSRLIVNHDLEITNFHLALENAINPFAPDKSLPPKVLNWRQWRDDLRDTVEIAEGKKSIIPDAYFTLGDQAFFLEIVKSYESEYVGGKSNIEQKITLYRWYKPRFREKYGYDDFRVLYVLPTVKRVQMLLGKIEAEFPYRKFWFTDEASYKGMGKDKAGSPKANILREIWWTPKDFRDRTYSLFE